MAARASAAPSEDAATSSSHWVVRKLGRPPAVESSSASNKAYFVRKYLWHSRKSARLIARASTRTRSSRPSLREPLCGLISPKARVLGESRGGISPPRAPRTGREPLSSSSSYSAITRLLPSSATCLEAENGSDFGWGTGSSHLWLAQCSSPAEHGPLAPSLCRG